MRSCALIACGDNGEGFLLIRKNYREEQFSLSSRLARAHQTFSTVSLKRAKCERVIISLNRVALKETIDELCLCQTLGALSLYSSPSDTFE